MRRTVLLIMALFMIWTLNATAQERAEVIYFYENYCETCDPEAEFAETFRMLTGMDLNEFQFVGYNVAHKSGRAAFEEILTELQLEDAFLPLTVVDGVVYQGSGELEANLPQASLEWGGGDAATSEIVYLYVPACGSCARAIAVLDSLPESVTVRRGDLTFESPVRVEKIDVSANSALADALFDAYEVPDEDRVTPSVFFSDRYLSGADEIERYLTTMVNIGRAAGGVAMPEGYKEGEGNSAPALSLTGTVGAGLVAGLNTCALSMLLLFLSVLLENRCRAGLLAFCFLGAKFVCYVLIGFLLMEVMQQMNPQWLTPLARWLLTVMGIILILMNIWDAWQAHLENYGRIRNQLPAGLRARLHRVIRALTRSSVLIPAVIALGFVVALGEFLCAGQIYLIRLLSAVEENAGAQALNLVVYCAAFTVPSAALCGIVLGGRSQMRASQFLSEHMAAFKLITAATMALLIIAAWLM